MVQDTLGSLTKVNDDDFGLWLFAHVKPKGFAHAV
jgi:hypothetical protein